MCDTHAIVCNVLDAIHSSLIAQIDECIDRYGVERENFFAPLAKQNWPLEKPYSKMEFRYEYSKLTFIGLCNSVEMMLGPRAEDEFANELRKQVAEHVEARLQLRIEQNNQDRAREWNWKREREIEQEAIA